MQRNHFSHRAALPSCCHDRLLAAKKFSHEIAKLGRIIGSISQESRVFCGLPQKISGERRGFATALERAHGSEPAASGALKRARAAGNALAAMAPDAARIASRAGPARHRDELAAAPRQRRQPGSGGRSRAAGSSSGSARA